MNPLDKVELDIYGDKLGLSKEKQAELQRVMDRLCLFMMIKGALILFFIELLLLNIWLWFK